MFDYKYERTLKDLDRLWVEEKGIENFEDYYRRLMREDKQKRPYIEDWDSNSDFSRENGNDIIIQMLNDSDEFSADGIVRFVRAAV